MLNLAVQYISDGFDAAMRMPWKALFKLRRIVIAKVIEQQKWTGRKVMSALLTFHHYVSVCEFSKRIEVQAFCAFLQYLARNQLCGYAPSIYFFGWYILSELGKLRSLTSVA